MFVPPAYVTWVPPAKCAASLFPVCKHCPVSCLSVTSLCIEKNQPHCHYPLKLLPKRAAAKPAAARRLSSSSSSSSDCSISSGDASKAKRLAEAHEVASYGTGGVLATVDTRSMPTVPGRMSLKRCSLTLHAYVYRRGSSSKCPTRRRIFPLQFLKPVGVACWKAPAFGIRWVVVFWMSSSFLLGWVGWDSHWQLF